MSEPEETRQGSKPDDADDATGQGFFSDKNVKSNVEPVAWDEANEADTDDASGHGGRFPRGGETPDGADDDKGPRFAGY